jgi:hypothetical protein
MAALAASTPNTYRGTGTDDVERLVADEVIYEGAALVEGAAAGSVQNHTTETAGFVGFALGEAAAGDVIQVKTRGEIVTPINAALSIGDEGTTVYCHGSNPADIDKTSTTGASPGKIVRVITAGSAGANLAVIYFEQDGYKSV